MKTRYAALSIILAALSLTACASTSDNLQRASAMSIGNNTLPENVTLSNIDRGATSVKWTAMAGGQTYSCSADDMVRRPYCAKR
jgi:starvation-inducible outer membrane lipoprotein